MSVKVPPEIAEAVEAARTELGMTRSEWLSLAVSEKLDHDSHALRQRADQLADAADAESERRQQLSPAPARDKSRATAGDQLYAAPLYGDPSGQPPSLAQGLYQCPSCRKSSEGPGECRECLGKPRDLSALMAHRGTPEEQARWALEYQRGILAGRIVPPAPGDGLRDGDVKGAPGPGAQPPGC
jgi:hypothetical protein